MQQLQQQQTGGGIGSASSQNPGSDDRKIQEDEARKSILLQILEPDAHDRLNRIRLVKESRAQDVEDRLIMLARSGQLRSKVTEDQLKEILGALSDKEEQQGRMGGGKITVTRKGGGAAWDEDDDLLDDL